jgi:exodeoxyribonuclease-5
LAADLLRYRKPILVLGDPAQLPPVKGAGYFINANPDVMLTEIHRQAADNPIIRMATVVREGGQLECGQYGDSSVIRRGVMSPDQVAKADQVLVGKNATRRQYNSRLRAAMGFSGEYPATGDKLVCLKNDKPLGIFNGGLFCAGEIERGNSRHLEFWAHSEDFPSRAPVKCVVRREFFIGAADDIPWQELRGTQQFDYGYALTCHKSQGSQWDDVIAYDESAIFREDAAKWLYTAITRAAKTITVVR